MPQFVNVDLSNTGDNLLINGLDVRQRRPYYENGKIWVNRRNREGKIVPCAVAANTFSANTAILLKEEWKMLDTAVIDAAKPRLRGVADLISRGLTLDIGEGLGITQLQWQTASKVGTAVMSMDGLGRARNDTPQYGLGTLPIPLIHYDWQINLRFLESSRNGNHPLDTTMAEFASDACAEFSENLLFNGSSLVLGEAPIYGYTTMVGRTTGTLGYDWAATATTGANILADIKTMRAAMAAKGIHGPFFIYVPLDVGNRLDDDYVVDAAKGTKTVRQRILEIEGITGIAVSDYLASDNVLMVEFNKKTVRLVTWNQGMRTFTWPTEGGFTSHMKVATIMVPNFRSDFNGINGICHYTAPG